MIALVTGLLTGFLMCIPIGPLNVWVINTFLKRNSLYALSIALGGSIMDLLYFYFILSGLSFIKIGASYEYYLKIAGITIIILLGVKELISREVSYQQQENQRSPKDFFQGIITGVIIYTSNPTLFLTMTALGAFIKSLELFPFSQLNIISLSLGLGIGSFLWFVFLIKFTERYKERIKTKFLGLFNKISGILMIGLGLLLAIRLYSNTEVL